MTNATRNEQTDNGNVPPHTPLQRKWYAAFQMPSAIDTDEFETFVLGPFETEDDAQDAVWDRGDIPFITFQGAGQKYNTRYPRGPVHSWTRHNYLHSDLPDRHRRYYAQYLNDRYVDRVGREAGEAILKSADPNFNDISLHAWDCLAERVFDNEDIKYRMRAQGDSITLAGLVCLAKEAAQQWLEARCVDQFDKFETERIDQWHDDHIAPTV